MGYSPQLSGSTSRVPLGIGDERCDRARCWTSWPGDKLLIINYRLSVIYQNQSSYEGFLVFCMVLNEVLRTTQIVPYKICSFRDIGENVS